MAHALQYAIVLLIADTTLVNLSVFAQDSSSVAESFISHQIVPDVVPEPPSSLVNVKHPSGAIVYLGNELDVIDVALQPSASWDADPDHLYTLAMVDPDAPSREFPILREIRHWLVVNIPGDNVDAGETLSKYLSPTPPPGSGLHRYIFLVYLQPCKLTFEESERIYWLVQPRTNFAITKFADKYNLGHPIAGNFFQAQLLSS